MGELIRLPVITRLNTNPDLVLQSAIDAGLDKVIVIGYDKDGDEYWASSIADGGECLWIIERFKKALLEVPENM